MKTINIKSLGAVLFIMSFAHVGCGVRGDPVPPLKTSEIGRGEPTYKNATKELAFPSVPPIYVPQKNTTEDENNGKETKKH